MATIIKESQIPEIKIILDQVVALALEMAIQAITTTKVAQTLVETIILEITAITKGMLTLAETITLEITAITKGMLTLAETITLEITAITKGMKAQVKITIAEAVRQELQV